MIILHTHWQPPTTSTDQGGLCLWAETSDAPQPPRQRGRLAKKPKASTHPFCLEHEALCTLDLWQEHLQSNGGEHQITLNLPSTRSGPQPSPALWHEWELDEKTPPFLAPWLISCLQLAPADALTLLTSLPADANLPPSISYGNDLRFWRTVAGLLLETLAAQKLVPVLSPASKGYHARWLPVLDGAKDGPRLARLEAAMPPLCRAGASNEAETPSPRHLLDSFIDITGDALARVWGRTASFHPTAKQEPDQRWLSALFSDDPSIRGSHAELDALIRGQRAWLRNLHVAGDAAFRIAFRLEAPIQQSHKRSAQDWQLHYLLQARDDPSLLVPASAVWQSKGRVLKEVGRNFEQPQEKLLAGLGYAGRLFPAITTSLKSARPDGVSLDTQNAYTFLRESAPLLEGAGFAILVPPWWNKPGSRLGVRLKLRPLQAQSSDAIPKSKLTYENLVKFKWEVALGDATLSQAEFEALVALKSPLVQIRGQWVQLDADQIEAAIRFWEGQQAEGDISLLEALQLGLGGEDAAGGLPIEQVETDGWLEQWFQRFTRNERMTELPQPAALQATLRPYQQFGFSWLHFLQQWGLGACLADDMGLGKTIQTITLLLDEKEKNDHLPAPTLLIAPTSVVTNWQREVQRFAPSLSTLVHQGPKRLQGDEFIAAVKDVDMVLSSYAVVRRDAEAMQQVDWYGLVLDEAQNIKNPDTKQTQAIRQLSAGFRVALTGTPVENRLSELWSIMHFLNPGYLGQRKAFRRDFALPIERYGDEDAANRLKTLVDPFILRRVKTDPTVIQDLPEKLEMKVYCHSARSRPRSTRLWWKMPSKRWRKAKASNAKGWCFRC